MATPKTVATYDLNGSLREFDFAFDYLARSFVQVTLIGATRVVLSEGSGYTFVSATRIRTTDVYGPPTFTQIEIRRVTSATERLVDFQDASILRADDLNLSDLQVLHIAEEAREAATETLGTNAEGMLDARGRRVVNVGNSVDRQDVLTYGQYLDDRSGTLAAKQAAELARDKAREWATSPNVVEGTLRGSKYYAEQASTSASASAASATFSDQRATASASSATFSDQRATASAASATFSDQRATVSLSASSVAEEYAQKPVDVPVSAGGYSALHWSAKAEVWAQQAGAVPLAVQQVAAAVRAMYSGLIGVPTPYPATDIPAGWVEMRGQSFNSAENPLLAAKYPSGVLPDLRNRFIRGTGASRVVLSFEANANKSHTHAITVSSGGAHGHSGTAASGGAHTHTVSGTAASAGAHTHYVLSAVAPTGSANSPSVSSANQLSLQRRISNSEGGSYSNTQYLFGQPGAANAGNSSSAGAHTHTVTGSAASGGAHTHTVTIAEGGAHAHAASAAAEGGVDARPDNIAFVWCCMTDAAIPELPTIGT